MKNLTPEQQIKSFEKKQIIVSIMCLMILSGSAVVFNALHLQSVADESTRFLSRMIKIGDFREASLILQQARLSSFTMIHYKSSEADRSFVIPPKAEVFTDNSLLNRITRDKISVKVALNTATQSNDEIIFEYERFRLVPYAFLIWLFLNLISIPQTRFLKRRLIEKFNEDMEIEKKLVKSEITQQVRHNLRTPLAALMRIPKKLPDSVAKDRELLELTIGQIRELISKLDDRPNVTLSEKYETDLYSTLEQAKRELDIYIPKSVEFRFETEDIVASALVKHIPFELRAILGNLVTNSLEALNIKGQILIRVRDQGANIQISVIDNGHGISPAILPKIFDKNFSEGKKSGSGIGLSHAKENIESWNGTISAESVLGVGTTITINLPIEDRASWYLPRLKFNSRSQIFVLDDQESALELWKLKLEESNLLKQTTLSKNFHGLSNYKMSGIEFSDLTFLFDYDLSQSQSGLDLLKNLPKSATRCLVTGNFDNSELRSTCVENGIYLLPKSHISDMPVIVR